MIYDSIAVKFDNSMLPFFDNYFRRGKRGVVPLPIYLNIQKLRSCFALLERLREHCCCHSNSDARPHHLTHALVYVSNFYRNMVELLPFYTALRREQHGPFWHLACIIDQSSSSRLLHSRRPFREIQMSKSDK